MKKQTFKKIIISYIFDEDFSWIYLVIVHLYKFSVLHLLLYDEIQPFWNHRRDETNTATILCLPEMLLSTSEPSENHLL